MSKGTKLQIGPYLKRQISLTVMTWKKETDDQGLSSQGQVKKALELNARDVAAGKLQSRAVPIGSSKAHLTVSVPDFARPPFAHHRVEILWACGPHVVSVQLSAEIDAKPKVLKGDYFGSVEIDAEDHRRKLTPILQRVEEEALTAARSLEASLVVPDDD